MNNPLDANYFRHYLRFISLGKTELYEICEPVGFDAANFQQDQEAKRWARSVEYGAIDKLDFVDIWGVGLITERAYNILGDTAEHLDSGLQFLLYIYKKYGFQSKVEYVLEKSDVQFSQGMLDFTDKDITDGYNYITTKVIQNDKVAFLKRQLDTKFNLYGTVNAKNEIITPADSVKFLRKAVPENKKSIWTQPLTKAVTASNATKYVNYALQITQFEIDNSLTPFEDGTFGGFNLTSAMENFIYIRALNDLSDITLNIRARIKLIYNITVGGEASTRLYYGIWQGASFNPGTDEYGILWQDNNRVGGPGEEYDIDENLTFDFPVVERGFNFSLFWMVKAEISGSVTWSFIDGSFDISLTETAIDTVVSGVMWIDGIKQADKYGSNLGVDAPLYDVGGIHYKNILFNKSGVSQNLTNFTATPKILLESVEENNCDYEADENGIAIRHQSGFYENVEIADFTIIPDEDFGIEENDRCMINKIDIGFKTFTQERTLTGTNEAIHTEAEFLPYGNDNVENTFDRKFELIRDPFTHQEMVNNEISKPTTSTTDDDKINIVEVVELEDGSFNEEGARLAMQIIDGNLQILNRASDADTNSVVINWLILGFLVGDSFEITFGENIDTYTVLSITAQVLTLTPTGTPTFTGDAYIRFKYYYNNVPYVTRTDEGFASNPLHIQNARYSIKRLMGYFGEYFASCLIYAKTNITNGWFKSNGAYTSQLDTEAEPVTENATVPYDSLPNPLTTAKVIKLTVVAEFEDVLAYLRAYKVDRGFVRCYDSYGRVYKGFVQKLDHLWAENKLTFTLEQKYDSELLVLTYADGILTVNDANYDLTGISNWWRFNNDFIILYDANNKPLCNIDDYAYNFVELNGVIYETKAELITALLSL